MPKTIYYRERNKPLAQALRREMTRHEKRLWYDYLNTCPVRFRRQKQFGQYIVDFYCAERKLVVEIDGSQHYEPEAQAKTRKERPIWRASACVWCDSATTTSTPISTAYAKR